MEKEFDFNSVAGCNEGLVELADIFNDINSELDEITEALRGTKSRKKVDCLLEEQIDWLREKWRRNLINYPVCTFFCDMCNSCGEKKDHRFYYSEQGLARIQNMNVRVGEDFFDFPDEGDKDEVNRELPRVGLPKTMFDRLGVVDTFGQGSGTEHLQKPKFAEDGRSLSC